MTVYLAHGVQMLHAAATRATTPTYILTVGIGPPMSELASLWASRRSFGDTFQQNVVARIVGSSRHPELVGKPTYSLVGVDLGSMERVREVIRTANTVQDVIAAFPHAPIRNPYTGTPLAPVAPPITQADVAVSPSATTALVAPTESGPSRTAIAIGLTALAVGLGWAALRRR